MEIPIKIFKIWRKISQKGLSQSQILVMVKKVCYQGYPQRFLNWNYHLSIFRIWSWWWIKISKIQWGWISTILNWEVLVVQRKKYFSLRIIIFQKNSKKLMKMNFFWVMVWFRFLLGKTEAKILEILQIRERRRKYPQQRSIFKDGGISQTLIWNFGKNPYIGKNNKKKNVNYTKKESNKSKWRNAHSNQNSLSIENKGQRA